MTWTAYEHHGWEQFSSTVRHELIHAWQYHEFGDADHGATFTPWIDALDTSQHREHWGCVKTGRKEIPSNPLITLDFPERRSTAFGSPPLLLLHATS
ncbi:SprT-like domain-containing protein [Haladaptatus litoreus]|uniref:SprT-like domain-containing protein n=1 Tax=Haladaptatus litoreus TaxID=553468 RepID=UPI001FE2497E|nr:SprT-like domain-containing protein [Haladaptatus litoreus]